MITAYHRLRRRCWCRRSSASANARRLHHERKTKATVRTTLRSGVMANVDQLTAHTALLVLSVNQENVAQEGNSPARVAEGFVRTRVTGPNNVLLICCTNRKKRRNDELCLHYVVCRRLRRTQKCPALCRGSEKSSGSLTW